MSSAIPVRTSPNLSAAQQFTQRLVDQFNREERKWRELQKKLDDVAARFKMAGKKRRKRASRRIVGFQMI